jgi:hypothetical protein
VRVRAKLKIIDAIMSQVAGSVDSSGPAPSSHFDEKMDLSGEKMGERSGPVWPRAI